MLQQACGLVPMDSIASVERLHPNRDYQVDGLMHLKRGHPRIYAACKDAKTCRAKSFDIVNAIGNKVQSIEEFKNAKEEALNDIARQLLTKVLVPDNLSIDLNKIEIVTT
jgi:hypothetical protein